MRGGRKGAGREGGGRRRRRKERIFYFFLTKVAVLGSAKSLTTSLC